MKISKLAVLLGVGVGLGIVISMSKRGSNRTVPQPAKPVDLAAYAGLWHEVGRYENPAENGFEAVTDDYVLNGGRIDIMATLHKGAPGGQRTLVPSKAKIVPETQNTKWKISFLGPLYLADYWILDRGDDYSWSIVGEPTGKLLWVMTRVPEPSRELWAVLEERVTALGYTWSNVRKVAHLPNLA